MLCPACGCTGKTPTKFKKRVAAEKMKISAEEKKELKFELEKTALHCSHAIVAARYSAEWPPRPLLDVSKWH